MTDEKKILESLLVDEEDIIKDLAQLVSQAKEIFVIEKSSGKVIFKDFGSLTDSQRICALLVGKFFAKKLGIISDASLAISEIGQELERPKRILSARLVDLMKKGFVEKLPKRKYSITYHRIKDVFKIYFRGKKNE